MRDAPARWLILAALLLLLANIGWWLLRASDGEGLWRQRPAPAVSERPAVVAPPPGAPVAEDDARPPAAARRPSTPGGPAAPSSSPASSAALLVPVQGVDAAQLHDTFGDARGSERQHEALDIMAPAGTPVLAVADGHVEKLFDSERGGLTVYQFEPSGRWCYYYAHLQRYAPGLVEGAAVERGQVLGYVGSSGNADPAAPHLHFAVFELGPERQWWAGTPVNPYPLLAGPPAR
jgi:murein DD-endopeptidase MepM/ murein hydrolase activator NlpD